MKMILLPLILFFVLKAHSQVPRQGDVSCPARIYLEITRQAGQTLYRFQQKRTPKYPLDTVGALVSRCTQIKGMIIIVDSPVPLEDLLTALDGSGKNQIDSVSVFIRKNGFYLPLTVGDQSSVDPTK